MESRQAKLDGKVVHYLIGGEGATTVVFVHGWASDTSVWDAVIPAYKGRAQIIGIDLPGHGKSEEPDEKYTMDLFAKAIAAVMDDAKVERAVLVGHSNGTPTIRQFYRRYPERTQALVIVDGALKQMFPPEAAQPFLEKLRGPDYKEFTKAQCMAVPGIQDATRDHIVAMAARISQSAIAGGMEANMDPAIWAEDKIEAPVLCVMTNAPFWQGSYEADIRTFVPDLDYQVMDGATHFLIMENPDEFNEIVIPFLESKGLLKRGK